MKYIFTLFAVFYFFLLPINSDDCENAYQSATYGYQHTKTSLEANNIEHLKYYAERAIKSIEEVQAATEECGCTKANNASYDLLDNLNKAIEQEKFETSRFYIKKSKELASDIIGFLDVCLEENPSYGLSEDEENLLAQEQQLLEQQKKLLEEQKRLEQRMKEQKQRQNEVRRQKAEELILQKKVRENAEVALQEFESAIIKLSEALECDQAYEIIEATYLKTNEQLNAESLDATKAHYAAKAREIAQNMLNQLDDCRSRSTNTDDNNNGNE